MQLWHYIFKIKATTDFNVSMNSLIKLLFLQKNLLHFQHHKRKNTANCNFCMLFVKHLRRRKTLKLLEITVLWTLKLRTQKPRVFRSTFPSTSVLLCFKKGKSRQQYKHISRLMLQPIMKSFLKRGKRLQKLFLVANSIEK